MQAAVVNLGGQAGASNEAGETDALEFEVGEDEGGMRLDRWLAVHIPAVSRSRLQTWIEANEVSVEGLSRVSSSTRLMPGQWIVVNPQDAPEEMAYAPEPVDFAVVHEDAQIIVVNKPAGLVVHPAAGNWTGTLLNGLLYRYSELLRVPRAGIVHRLDKDTSGLMVVARDLSAQMHLTEQIKQRSMSRRYVAFTTRPPAPRAGTVQGAIGRDTRNRLRMALVASGKSATTHYETVAISPNNGPARVHCALETGRTHQIRVHLASLKAPLLADVLYGAPPSELIARQALHAGRLELQHPASSASLSFAADLPADMAQVVAHYGLDAADV
jgi:23S rRNA pseudouridine1911/1915/1917 synthase